MNGLYQQLIPKFSLVKKETYITRDNTENYMKNEHFS
jgi:hypothetical protein